jgi:hypothetical protein
MSNATILACYRESPLETEELVAGEVWSSIGGLYRLLVQAIVPGHEATYGFLWLKSVLGADSTLAANAPGGIWRGSAPSGTTTPYVIIGLQSGLDVLTLNAVRIMTQPLYQVRAIGPAAISTTIAAAANEIDVLLARTSGMI